MDFFSSSAKATAASAQNFYDFSATDIDGSEISMSQYKGNVVVVVNVASD